MSHQTLQSHLSEHISSMLAISGTPWYAPLVLPSHLQLPLPFSQALRQALKQFPPLALRHRREARVTQEPRKPGVEGVEGSDTLLLKHGLEILHLEWMTGLDGIDGDVFLGFV